LHSYFLVLISAFPCYFVAFCQRFIYEYIMDMDMDMDMDFTIVAVEVDSVDYSNC